MNNLISVMNKKAKHMLKQVSKNRTKGDRSGKKVIK